MTRFGNAFSFLKLGVQSVPSFLVTTTRSSRRRRARRSPHLCARADARAGFLATGAMPLNRKRPPVTIQVPEVPRAVYELSESGTFTENLEISRSGMRIAGARSSAGGIATADGAPGAGPPGDAAAPEEEPAGARRRVVREGDGS